MTENGDPFFQSSKRGPFFSVEQNGDPFFQSSKRGPFFDTIENAFFCGNIDTDHVPTECRAAYWSNTSEFGNTSVETSTNHVIQLRLDASNYARSCQVSGMRRARSRGGAFRNLSKDVRFSQLTRVTSRATCSRNVTVLRVI